MRGRAACMGQDGGVCRPGSRTALAKPHPDQLDLRMHDKVVAKVELPGVPAGTKGKVILADGFNWLRYRVLFDNGAELGDLDERHLEPDRPGGRAAGQAGRQGGRAGR